MKRVAASFYRSDDGREPVREWLDRLTRDLWEAVVSDVASIELGWPDRMPAVERMAPEIFSVRSACRDGTKEAWTYFSIEGGQMLLLHGLECGQAGSDEAARRLDDHRRRSRIS